MLFVAALNEQQEGNPGRAEMRVYRKQEFLQVFGALRLHPARISSAENDDAISDKPFLSF